MRAGERESVTGETGARDGEGPAVGVAGRGGDRGVEQRDQRLRVGQRRVAFAQQGEGEAADRLGIGRALRQRWRGRDLAPDGDARLGHAAGDRFGRRIPCGAELVRQALKLGALGLEPEAQRIPPADIGAPVGVAPDP